MSICIAKLQCLLDLIELFSIDGNSFTANDFNVCFQEYYLTGRQERSNGSPMGPSLFTAIQIPVYDQLNTRESHIKHRVSHFTCRKIGEYRIRWSCIPKIFPRRHIVKYQFKIHTSMTALSEARYWIPPIPK